MKRCFKGVQVGRVQVTWWWHPTYWGLTLPLPPFRGGVLLEVGPLDVTVVPPRRDA